MVLRPQEESIYSNKRFSSDAAMERTLATAETMITKWNGRHFILCKSHFSLLREPKRSERLHQNLMETAMKRLQEGVFTNPIHESGSSGSGVGLGTDFPVFDPIQSGIDRRVYDIFRLWKGMCVTIYKIIRKSIVDEGIYKLGVEKFSSSQIQKMDWDALELKINKLVEVCEDCGEDTVQRRENSLRSSVAAASESIKESLFSRRLAEKERRISMSWSTSSTAILRQQSRQCRSRTLIPPTPTSLQHRQSPSDSRGSSSFSYANSTEKSKHYKDVSLAYLFLANNLQHVINKVRTSNIQYLLGDDWVTKHESKVKQFAANYERLGWGHVIDSMPEDPTAEMPPEAVKEFFRRFNTAFEQAHHKQAACVVPDRKLRDEIKSTIARKVMAAYRQFYNHAQGCVARRERNLNLLVRFCPLRMWELLVRSVLWERGVMEFFVIFFWLVTFEKVAFMRLHFYPCLLLTIPKFSLPPFLFI
ncbi:exocyst subunit exo70 family protein H4 [Actinidia rufa]|uniref:Exocyst subunit Exo70 family protein n=1 Tax=Actinidia rufa TaxID=165716 RepID=A0A7J0ER34_9ERIC|nr:exocyst subunit exo70 family protein H4 [Actinidia rufa]